MTSCPRQREAADTALCIVGRLAPVFYRRCAAVLAVLGLLAVPPHPPALAASEPAGFELSVRPRVCVTLSSDSDCEMALTVSWSAATASDVCVRLQGSEDMLECWRQQRTGEFELELRRRDNAIVQLLDQETNAVLDQAEVTVVSRDLRDSRRRRRHVWSII